MPARCFLFRPPQSPLWKQRVRIQQHKTRIWNFKSNNDHNPNNCATVAKRRWSSGSGFSFQEVHRSRREGSRARVCRVSTPHGCFETPCFVPVATHAAVKAVSPLDAAERCDTTLTFANTYHLMVHPGVDVIEKAGGIHSFMNYHRPIITDSGGFQVFSLAYGTVQRELQSGGQLLPNEPGMIRVCFFCSTVEAEVKRARRRSTAHRNGVKKISEDGVTFRSYRDGRLLVLSPEGSIDAQKRIGADFIVAFDELPPYNITPEKLRQSFDRTHRWQKRSIDADRENPTPQVLYGIVHGGTDAELRAESLDFLLRHDFPAIAIGGSLGKDKDDVAKVCESLSAALPHDRPVHLLGIGDEELVRRCVAYGIDTFDATYPTRNARHGTILAPDGQFHIKNARFKTQTEAMVENCDCYTCRHYSAAYLHHLHKVHEPIFAELATIHNLHYMAQLMSRLRADILADLI